MFDVSAMGTYEQCLDRAFIPERRRGIFVERGTMESERRSCDIIPGLKRTNMSLHTELDFTSAPDYIDAAPTALPEGLGGFEPPQLDQASGSAEVANSVNLDIRH
jgi:hypothetical protein